MKRDAQRSTESRAAIKPEDVPDELITLACDAWWDHNPTWSRPVTEHQWEAAPAILAAVLPVHEAMVREQVAAAIDARGREPRLDDEDPISREEWACFGESAEIARGEA